MYQLHRSVFCLFDSWHTNVVIISEFHNEDKQEKDKAITSKNLEINEEHCCPQEGSECMYLRNLGKKVNGLYLAHVKEKQTKNPNSLARI